MESVLNSIKKLLGIAEDYTVFDTDLIIHINSVLSILTQLGVGPPEGFSIEGPEDEWVSFVDDSKVQMVRTYVYMKVRLVFDPPSSSAVIKSMEDSIKEYEWRLNVAVDPA